MKQRQHFSQVGQVGVVVVLIMAGMLTIGLSLAIRTTQDVLLSGQEPESARVFSAAEQGIEQALSSNLDFSGDTYTGSLETVEGVDVDFTVNKVNTLQTRIFEGMPVGVNVAGAVDDNILQIDWSKDGDCDSDKIASVILSIFSDDGGTTSVRHLAIGGCERDDGFRLADTIDENGYKRRYGLSLQTGDFLVRIKPVYNDTYLNVSSTSLTLPVQYYAIRSEAANQAGEEARAVEVNQTVSTAPSVFDYTLYSGYNLRK